MGIWSQSLAQRKVRYHQAISFEIGVNDGFLFIIIHKPIIGIIEKEQFLFPIVSEFVKGFHPIGNGIVRIPLPLTVKYDMVFNVVEFYIVLTGCILVHKLLKLIQAVILGTSEMCPVKTFVRMGHPKNVGSFKTQLFYWSIISLNFGHVPPTVAHFLKSCQAIVGSLDICGILVGDLDQLVSSRNVADLFKTIFRHLVGTRIMPTEQIALHHLQIPNMALGTLNKLELVSIKIKHSRIASQKQLFVEPGNIVDHTQGSCIIRVIGYRIVKPHTCDTIVQSQP